MFRFPCRLILISGLVVFGFASGQETPGDPARRNAEAADPAEGVAFFEKKIRPVLVAECYGCHSTEKAKKVRGGLALDTREGARKGGDSGPVIVPGSPSRSLLIKALGHGDPKLAMHPRRSSMRPSFAISRNGSAWERPTRAMAKRSLTRISTSSKDATTGPTSCRKRWRHPQ